MKVVNTFKNTLLLIAIVIASSMVPASASSATSMSQEMSGMDHSANEAGLCASLCRTTLINRDKPDAPIRNEDDDGVDLPLYPTYKSSEMSEKVLKQKLYADTMNPPPDIAAYILHGVFRV